MLRPSRPSPVSTLGVATIALLGALLLAASPARAAKRYAHVSITVVSSRADLVSGGSALVAISPTRTARRLKVTVDGRIVTGRFGVRANRSFEGLVRGLKLGRNVLRATLPNGAGARITLVNHPIGGPLYETGYMDRDQYQIATLLQPGKPWTTFNPQRQFNHKLLILHGFGCAVQYEVGNAPTTTGDSAGDYALGKGFMTMSTALDNSSQDCNVAVQAESLVMAKEYVVKTYGTLRYTIGTGCSGGSLAQYWIANAYPGVYQGILPTCSFPDAWTSATQVADYALLEHYFFESTLTGGAAWMPSQEAAVEGIPTTANAFVSVGCTNVNPPYTPATCPTGYFYGAVPYWPCPGVTSQQLYNAQTNPGGVRCSIADLAKNLLGREQPSVWSPAEKKIGHGFAGVPFDNVGVQYGLGALRDGAITGLDVARYFSLPPYQRAMPGETTREEPPCPNPSC